MRRARRGPVARDPEDRMETQPSFLARLALALRVLTDAALAGRVVSAAASAPAAPAPAQLPPPPRVDTAAHLPASLAVLGMLQREGRLVDFLQEDITSFPDADVGAAVRVVHEGCRKALRSHMKLAPVMEQEEGAAVTVAAGFDAVKIRLTGNVVGQAPFKGTLKHRGWKVSEVTLPPPPAGVDGTVLAPAEVEL